MTAVPDQIALLESLTEARLDLVYLERKARESGDKAGAAALAQRAQTMKTQIADLRRLSHEDFRAAALPWAPRIEKAIGALQKVRERDQKRTKALNAAARTLAAADDALKVIAKVL